MRLTTSGFLIFAAAATIFNIAASAETIKIGISGPLTGPIARLGKDAEYGARLAIADANQQGIVVNGTRATFELVSEDDQGDPKTAVQVAQRLVDAGVSGIVGHLNSGTTIVASRVYANAGIPQIAPVATNPTLTQQGFRTTYRIMATDVQQGAKLAAFARQLAPSGRIALVDDRSAYGQGLIDEVEKDLEASGIRPVAREYTSEQAVDFSAILTSMKAANPAVIIFGGADAQAGPMVRRMAQLGMKADFIGGDGVCTADWTRLSGGANEGQYCTQAGAPHDRMAGYPRFAERLEKGYGTKVVAFAPYSYDATRLMINAMQRANSSNPRVYVSALASSHYEGVTGKIAFTGNGDNRNGEVWVYQVRKGELVPINR
ncbi:branched-chain amino acid ABC transporter substrate-binding protein [Paraburkholderia agricolaris]|uniref:Branched-chain amino acid ABC transporter substrate-binding protein n=1 Tax=Paraburkholderia agricolaris TaxID=2152888 RepID=A0ABW8ZXT8_9BURK